jgi:hypothetical protein
MKMTNTILNECKEIIRDLVGHGYLYFDHAVEMKLSPHTHSFLVWAVSVSPQPMDELYVMDGNEVWHKVSTEDRHAAMLIGSLYQRLKVMRINYAKAS